jgi:hypothetical protein
VRDPIPQALVWFHIAALYATGSAAELVNAIGTECPPRPVPWTIWACFWLAFLALTVAGYWVSWLYWNAFWQWAARLWAKLRRRDDGSAE